MTTALLLHMGYIEIVALSLSMTTALLLHMSYIEIAALSFGMTTALLGHMVYLVIGQPTQKQKRTGTEVPILMP